MTIRRICSRCIYDEAVPAITFDAAGVCNYCHQHDALDRAYPNGPEGERILEAIFQKIREAGRGRKYDCVVGVSGGCDSSFLLYKCVQMGLRPLAAHFDNTWNSAIATENIHKMLKKLNVDLFTIVVDNKEYDDIYRSFLQAGVPDIEAPTDIGLAVTLYRAAEKHGIKYRIEGHSFRTEGVSPLGWLYMDGKYIQSVHRQYGKLPMKTFPNMPLHLFLKWMVVSRIMKVRPLYYMDYQKQATKEFLAREFGWKWYGGHHLENRFTAFYHTYFLYRRFGIDTRLLEHAALVRSGQMSRDAALTEISRPREFDPELLELVKKRLGYSDDEFERLMTQPKRTYREFKTYKQTFEKMRPLFWFLQKFDLVSQSFYMKYTLPDPSPK